MLVLDFGLFVLFQLYIGRITRGAALSLETATVLNLHFLFFYLIVIGAFVFFAGFTRLASRTIVTVVFVALTASIIIEKGNVRLLCLPLHCDFDVFIIE